jgi:hypothetical protein
LERETILARCRRAASEYLNDILVSHTWMERPKLQSLLRSARWRMAEPRSNTCVKLSSRLRRKQTSYFSDYKTGRFGFHLYVPTVDSLQLQRPPPFWFTNLRDHCERNYQNMVSHLISLEAASREGVTIQRRQYQPASESQARLYRLFPTSFSCAILSSGQLFLL